MSLAWIFPVKMEEKKKKRIINQKNRQEFWGTDGLKKHLASWVSIGLGSHYPMNQPYRSKGYKWKEYQHLFWEIWEIHKVSLWNQSFLPGLCEPALLWYRGVVTFIWHFYIHVYVHIYMYYMYMCMHAYVYMGLWVSCNFFIKILLPNRSLWSCWQYMLPKRSLKSIWSIRKITVGVLPTSQCIQTMYTGPKSCVFKDFPICILFKDGMVLLSYECAYHTWMALSWHIFP